MSEPNDQLSCVCGLPTGSGACWCGRADAVLPAPPLPPPLTTAQALADYTRAMRDWETAGEAEQSAALAVVQEAWRQLAAVRHARLGSAL